MAEQDPINLEKRFEFRGEVTLSPGFFCTPTDPQPNAVAHRFWQIVRLNQPHPTLPELLVQTRRCLGCGLAMCDETSYVVVDMATENGMFLGWLTPAAPRSDAP